LSQSNSEKIVDWSKQIHRNIPTGTAANPDITGSMARGPGGLVWQAPAGWRLQPDRTARVVTFHLGP
jgi:hypothetical protein